MRELGATSEALHDALAREALGDGIDLVVAVGEFADAMQRVAPDDPQVLRAADPEEAWARLEPRLARDAVLLLKGSRGVRLERLLPPLTTWASA
jgi:UDP-N-acetylmuramoyl-tripeptide--D-alanyl-D-alanine ligase